MKISELEDLISRIEFSLEYEDYQLVDGHLLNMILATRRLIAAVSKLDLNF